MKILQIIFFVHKPYKTIYKNIFLSYTLFIESIMNTIYKNYIPYKTLHNNIKKQTPQKYLKNSSHTFSLNKQNYHIYNFHITIVIYTNDNTQSNKHYKNFHIKNLKIHHTHVLM